MDRYIIYRKMAIKTWQEINELANNDKPFYEAMCLGKSSFVREWKFEIPFELISCKNYLYFSTNKYHKHYLGDRNLKPLGQNCNEHFLFRDEQTANDYVEACRNDEDECSRYRLHTAMLDEWGGIRDDDYEYDDELLDTE